MRKLLPIAALLLLVAVSCIEKDPSWEIHWGQGGSGEVNPGPGPAPKPDPDTTVTPSDVPLLESFVQEFSTTDTAPFDFSLHQGREDFRYYPGFPSLTESGTDILMLRLDPADTPTECPQLTASAYTFYGSYSIRVRTPDLSRLKKTTDAVFEFCLRGDDPKAGVSGIGLKWNLSVPGKITTTALRGTLNTQSGYSVAVPLSEDRNPGSKFQTLGWDWTPDYVKWWILDPSSKEKKVIGEITAKDEVPFLAGILSVSVRHDTDAPEYPFETEIDRISYEPY